MIFDIWSRIALGGKEGGRTGMEILIVSSTFGTINCSLKVLNKRGCRINFCARSVDKTGFFFLSFPYSTHLDLK